VHRAYRDRGLVVVAIDIEESPEAVARWVRARGLTVPVVLDRDGAVTRAWQVTVTPTVFLLDRQGRVRGKALGTRPWTAPDGRALLEALLAA